MLFVGTSIIHHSTEGVFLLCNILDLLIHSSKLKKSPFTDAVISIICAILFTIALAVYYAKMGAEVSPVSYG